jgi:sigma-B regulation protein RsbU (phosphoserine phosphatase)
VFVACVVAILGVGVLDEVTGVLPDLTILYLVPIVIAVLVLGLPAALSLVALAFVVEVVAQLQVGLYPTGLVILDGVIHLVVRGLFVIALDYIQRQLLRIRELKSESDFDLALAAHVHESFFTSPVTARGDLALGLRIEFLRAVGGDYYRVVDTPSGLFVCIADISGKGVSAALFTAALDRAVNVALSRSSDVGQVLRFLNESMVETLPNDRFVTCLACLVDDSGVTYANAGHEPPLVFRRGPEPRVDTLEGAGGVPLGILPENSIESLTVQFSKGDIMLMVTDGVTESDALSDQPQQRLAALLIQNAAGGAQHVCDAVASAVSSGGSRPKDDVVAVAVERV